MRLKWLIILCICLPGWLGAGDWPRFRGSKGNGVTEERDLPTRWSAGEGVRWKMALPANDVAACSPVVAGGRVFLTYGTKGGEHRVLCLDAENGGILWDVVVPPGPQEKPDARAGRAPLTPCTDGTYVFAAFPSGVLVCLDMQGQILWRQALANYAFDCSMGNSPLLYGDRVILINDQNSGKSEFLAYDKQTGEIKVRLPRPECRFGHSTPALIQAGGTDQLLVAANPQIQGLDPLSGKVLWFAPFEGETASPAWDGDLAYCDNGRGQGGVTVRPAESGKTTIVAKIQIKSDLGSPVILGEYLYRQEGQTLRCARLADGQLMYTMKVPGASSWASPLATRDGRIYVGNAGACYVMKAGPQLEVISTNDLGDGSHASPAAADGRLYLRGTKFLWCVGAK